MENGKGFKKPNNSEFLILQKEFATIKSVLSFIESELINRHITVCTKSKEVVFKIEQRNISHLLGISYNGGGKALWKDFKRKRLALGSIEIKQDGTTFQKLTALHSFSDLFTKESYLTGEGKYERLVFDSSLRTNRLLLAIGLNYSGSGNIYYPSTTLNLKSKIIPNGEKVIAIYTENCITGEIKFLHRQIGFEFKNLGK